MNVLGIMSGTSLDGVDLVLTRFEGKKWEIINAQTIGYSIEWVENLRKAPTMSAAGITELDRSYAKHLATLVNSTLAEWDKKIDLIASHGHTIFHQPEKGFTLQIGHPGVIAAHCNIPVVGDFRSQDVALGGQGAPLVPKGDADLFPEYDACLNLGGIANISWFENGLYRAGDITFCNLALNYLAEKIDQRYDKNGEIARSGKVLSNLLQQLQALDFHHQPFPRSTGREWMESDVYPLLNAFDVKDAMRTCVELIALQVQDTFSKINTKKVLVTGGGAHHHFLMEKIREFANSGVEIPDSRLVDFKEGLIFAYLGYLRFHQQNSTIQSVTGAKRETSAGALYLP